MKYNLHCGAMVRRILRAYRLATAAETRHGLNWYRRGNRLVQGLSRRFDVTPEAAAGILAALSPACPWERNIRDAVALIREREAAVVSTYGAQKRKALAILDGADPAVALGGGRKTQAFYRNLLDPEAVEAVTVDRHAARIALDWTAGPDAVSQLLQTKRGYEAISDAYRRAGELLDLRPHEVQAVTWVVYRERFTRAR